MSAWGDPLDNSETNRRCAAITGVSVRAALIVTVGYTVTFWGLWLTQPWWRPQLWWDISIPWGPIMRRLWMGISLNALTVFVIVYLAVLMDRRFRRPKNSN